MKTTSSALLEFDELKHLIGRYVMGPLGHAELERLVPGSNREHIEAALVEVEEAVEFSRINGKLPLSQEVDITEQVAKLRIEGAALDGREIADLTSFLDRAVEAKHLLASDPVRFPRLVERAAGMGDFRSL